ncbi:MAG: restriction endonuclease subunit S [Oscillospiraceae bacterium]
MTAQQLKNSILLMAVQGKLVPQDPNDEPASVLLERIHAEKERLIKEKKIKREKNPSVIFKGADNTPYEKIGDEVRSLADEVPFDIPDSWEWVRLIDVCEYIQRGKSPKYSPIKKYPVVAQKCNQWSGFSIEKAQFIEPNSLSSYGPERLLQDNDLMWNSTGLGTLGRMAIYKTAANPYELAVADSHVTVIRPLKQFVLPEYLYYYFANPSVQSVIEDQADGTTKQKELATATIKAYLTPIPPLDEQRRILAKLSEVLPVVKNYGVVYDETTAMQEAFPESLKKSILQEAVQGKLVPQDPSDEPAEALLERIRAEKQRLIKEGKIKKDKHESVIFRRDNSHYEKLNGVERCIDDELPFEIPPQWCWIRFESTITLLSGTDFAPDEYNSAGKGIAYITGASNIVDSQILVNRWTETPRQIAHAGDVLLVCKGSGYGKTVICNIAQAHIARQIMAVQKSDLLDMQYVKLFLDSSFDHLKAKGQGVIPGIDRTSVLHLLFPLPPLAEQHRIVQRIEELLPLVKGL